MTARAPFARILATVIGGPKSTSPALAAWRVELREPRGVREFVFLDQAPDDCENGGNGLVGAVCRAGRLRARPRR